MKVALIGATGNVGSRILTGLLSRGHEVTGIVRHPARLQPHDRLVAPRGDINDGAGPAQLLARHDACISSVKCRPMGPRILIEAVKRAGVKRLLAVGGAGSLEVAPNVQLVDAPDFPAAYQPEALAGRDFLNVLRDEREIDRTFLSPPALLVPGRLHVSHDSISRPGEHTFSRGSSAVGVYNYAYHIGALSAVVCPDHLPEKLNPKYIKWANVLSRGHILT